MSEVLLKIENLNKSFGITHANVNINFELKAGEVRGLAGENGSGKSTLLSQIAGLYGSDFWKNVHPWRRVFSEKPGRCQQP